MRLKKLNVICCYTWPIHQLPQWCTNVQCHFTWATKFCMVALNICGSSTWNLLLNTLKIPRLLRSFLDFWKICGPLS